MTSPAAASNNSTSEMNDSTSEVNDSTFEVNDTVDEDEPLINTPQPIVRVRQRSVAKTRCIQFIKDLILSFSLYKTVPVIIGN